MVKMKMFGIMDQKLPLFGTPFAQLHIAQAMRAFEQLVQDPQSQIARYPSDFALFELGEFDQESGLFTSLDKPKMIMQAMQCVQPDPQLPLGGGKVPSRSGLSRRSETRTAGHQNNM